MADGLPIEKHISVQFSAQVLVDLRIIKYEEHRYVVVDDLARALGATNMRRACSDQTLNQAAEAESAQGWMWLKVEQAYERCLSLLAVEAYARALLDFQLIADDCYRDGCTWASRVRAEFGIYDIAIRRKRIRREPSPLQLEDEDDDDVYDYQQQSSSSSSSSSSDSDDDDDDDVERVELTFEQMQQINDVCVKHIQASVMLLSTLPPDSTERIKAQVAMHNSNAVLNAIHPWVNPAARKIVVFPRLPAVARPVRVSERVAALGYDRGEISPLEYQRIGVMAAELYRRGNLAGPWKVVAWSGNQQVERYYYTEQTAHYIDEAIRQILG